MKVNQEQMYQLAFITQLCYLLIVVVEIDAPIKGAAGRNGTYMFGLLYRTSQTNTLFRKIQTVIDQQTHSSCLFILKSSIVSISSTAMGIATRTKLLQSIPLFEAVVMQANPAFVTTFTSVFVTHSTASLSCKWLLIVIQMIHTNVLLHSCVRRKNNALQTTSSWSMLSVAFQLRLDNSCR